MKSFFLAATLAIPLASLAVACAGEFREPAPPGESSMSPPIESSAQPPTPTAPTAPIATAPSASSSASASAAPLVPPPPPTTGTISGEVLARPEALGGKNIVVYLEDGPKGTGPGPTVRIDQRGMSFFPLVTSIAIGGKITFLNSDPFPHNVFSPSGEKFNLGAVGRGGALTRQFDQPGAYTVLCNLHPGMIAFILVTPSSFYTRANAAGQFSMPGVPAGTYKVTAWGPRLVPQTQSVTVGAGDAPVHFQLSR